ncbi:MAG: hypothetical protein MRY32_10025 [Rickettsiales bacterium]|nr:hypothetical protein [Rickettsiales bacterium]
MTKFTEKLERSTEQVDFNKAAELCFKADAKGLSGPQLAQQLNDNIIAAEYGSRGV